MASTSSASLTDRFAPYSWSISSLAACRVVKKTSCAARNRAHRASSSLRLARGEAFHSSISRRYSPAAKPQSVDDGQRLRLGDQLLLGGLGRRVVAVQLGEVGAAVPVEDRPGGAEPLPQRVLVAAAQPDAALLGGLPALEELVHPRAGGLPLDLRGIVPGNLLGLGDDGLAGRQFGGADGVVLGLLGLLQLADLRRPVRPAGPPRTRTSPTMFRSASCSRRCVTRLLHVRGGRLGASTRCSSRTIWATMSSNLRAK